MTALRTGNTTSRRGWLTAILVLASAANPWAAPAEMGDSDPDDVPDAGFTASGEIRELAGSTLTLRPWQPRLPSRFPVKTTSRTRIFRQRTGHHSDLREGELVLVVEEPPNEAEKEQRRQTAEARRNAKNKGTPVRAARARAVVRCWKADHSDVTPENRQIARALLNGARPFFKGAAMGGVRAPGTSNRYVFGTVTRLEPFTLRAAKRVIEYSVTKDTLVLNHIPVTLGALKRGENLLVYSASTPAEGQAAEAAVVAVTPRPRLKLDQQRRLILRDRRTDKGDE